MIRRIRSEETGTALALALAFLSLMGVFMASLLGFNDTSFRATIAVRAQRGTQFGADGGVEAAVNDMRANILAGREVTPDSGAVPCDLTVAGVNGVSVSVQCEPAEASGRPTGASSANKPPRAIITIPDPSAPTEIGVTRSSSGTIYIQGGVLSNTTLQISGGGGINATGKVDVKNAPCAANVVGNPYTCPWVTPPPDAVDPNYLPMATSAPPDASVPASCTAFANKVIPMSPGSYRNAQALTDLVRHSSCSGALFWFQPGVYYFEFAGATKVWEIFDAAVNIVGGEPLGWDPNAPTRPAVSFTGGCRTDQTVPAATDGVQFIFGGESQMYVRRGTMELCPKPSLYQQQISVYGLKTTTAGSPPMVAQSGCVTTAPASSGCYFLRTATGAGADFAAMGTLYAPRAAVEFRQTAKSSVVAGRGMIVRTIQLQVTPPGSDPLKPMILTPASSGVPRPRQVTLTARIAGLDTIRAFVEFVDFDTVTGLPIVPATVRVLAWSVLR